MEAVILAGGLGTRLKPLVKDVPKPMAPINGKPFLEYVIRILRDQGTRTVVLSVGYLAERIHDHFGDLYQGVAIKYAIEKTPLGTGGAIRNALQYISGKDALVLNGDTIQALDVDGLLAKHHAVQGNRLTVAAKWVENAIRYGKCVIEDGVIVAFREKGDPSPGYVNTGVYVVSRGLFEGSSLPEAFSFEKDFVMAQLPELRPQAYCDHDPFLDIGIPEDYLHASEWMAEHLHL